MGRTYKRHNNNSYPEEKEGNIRDTNKKLRDEIKSLKKIIKNLESENKTLTKSFNKSCDFINESFSDKNVEEVIETVNQFDKKKTEQKKHREEAKKKENRVIKENECPKCFMTEGRGFKTIDFDTFKVLTCVCGYRTRVNKKNERIEGS